VRAAGGNGAPDSAYSNTAAATTATAPAVNTVYHTTATDFGGGTPAGTVVTAVGDGSVELARVSDDFNGSALGTGWTSTAVASAPSNTVSGGLLSMKGTQVRSAAPGAGLVEGRVKFTAAWQYFGFGTDFTDATGNYWAAFSTKGTAGTLYARVNANGAAQSISLGATPSGYHTYTVKSVSGRFDFYIDGALKGSLTQAMPSAAGMKVAMAAMSGTMGVDWARSGYASGGTLTSSVIDAGRTATWGALAWTATLPPGTSIWVETSTGNTAVPDGTWSAWGAVGNGGTASSPAGRYLRYRVTFITSDAAATPVLSDVVVNWS
jgi:hypothetical protein